MEGKPMTSGVDKPHAHLRLASNRSAVANETSSVSHRSTWGTVRAGFIVDERKAKLLDQVREALRVRHSSLRTEAAYSHWVERFMLCHARRHPPEMGEAESAQFLSALAVERHVSASTQHQALCARLLLYRHVLDLNLGWLDNVVRAKQPHRLPVV